MQKLRNYRWLILFLLIHCLTACIYYGQRYLDSTSATLTTPTTPTTPTSPAATCATLTASDSLTMVCIPANTAGFLMGSNAVGGSSIPEHTVASITAFAMAKYEVNYADWLIVKTWAEAQIPAYAFANAGVIGSGGQTNQHPVTTVSWRDAIIWCNAASQKDGLTPVYYTDAGFTTPLKIVDGAAVSGATISAGAEDNPYVNWSANGYRLPTEAEWEYVARYIDGTTFNPGDYASGATADYTNAPATGLVAWYTSNSGGVTHVVGTALGNALGLFDMSGNASEWVWDWAGTYTSFPPYTVADGNGPITGTFRVIRGAWFSSVAINLQGAFRFTTFGPTYVANDLGFRVVRRP